MLPSLHIGRLLAAWLTVSLIYAAAVTLFVRWVELSGWESGKQIAAVLGLSLGVLLVFRINTANETFVIATLEGEGKKARQE